MSPRNALSPATGKAIAALAGVALWAGLLLAAAHGAASRATLDAFVKSAGTQFTLRGKPFFVTGVNNHYLTYASQQEVVRVLDDAAAMGANIVRTFLQPVIGSKDGAVPTIWDWKSAADSSHLGVHGRYLLYWDDAAHDMAINDGPNGMQRVDFLIAQAKQRHLRLLISLLDFWPYTGGAQQMRAWYGSANRSTFFFADPRTIRDYRNWLRDVVNRTNSFTGVAYKNDPTIFGWDLMNEGNAEPETLREAWLHQMSAYLKSVDPHHLVGSGLANINGAIGDFSIASEDFVTWHGYPLYEKLNTSQFNAQITHFCQLAAAYRKPVLLEEFGYARSNANQVSAYTEWLRTLTHDPDCAGWVVWRLVSRQDSGDYPEDAHDQFDIHDDAGPLWHVLQTAVTQGARRAAGPAFASGDQKPEE